MTKLMTAYLLIEKIKEGSISPDDIYVVSSSADFRNAPPHSSLMFLEEGQSVTVMELLKGLAVCSGNDAAAAVAEVAGGDIENFVKMMNSKAEELGFSSFFFADPSGYSGENRVDALDFCRFCRIFIDDCRDYFPEITALRSFAYPKPHNLNGRGSLYGTIVQNNNNDFLGKFEGVDGLKTGFTDESGYNIALTAEQDGMRLIAVIMGIEGGTPSDGRIKRIIDGARLLSYGFDCFRTFVPVLPEKVSLPLYFGGSRHVSAAIGGDKKITVPYNKLSDLSYKITLSKGVKAPVEKGETVGRCVISCRGNCLGSFALVAESSVKEGSVMQKILDLFRYLFRSFVRSQFVLQ